MLQIALAGRTDGFLAIAGKRTLTRLPNFWNARHKEPERKTSKDATTARAELFRSLENMRRSPNPRSQHLKTCKLMADCAAVVLAEAKAGDSASVNVLFNLVTEILREIQTASGNEAFGKAIRRYAHAHVNFPVLLGNTTESLKSAKGYMADIGVGQSSGLLFRINPKGKTADATSVGTYAYLALSIIEYFEMIRTMVIHIPNSSSVPDAELKRVDLSRQTYDRIRKLRSISSENWDEWYRLSADFLKERYGTLKEACGVLGNAVFSHNPSSQLRKAFKSVVGKAQPIRSPGIGS